MVLIGGVALVTVGIVAAAILAVRSARKRSHGRLLKSLAKDVSRGETPAIVAFEPCLTASARPDPQQSAQSDARISGRHAVSTNKSSSSLTIIDSGVGISQSLTSRDRQSARRGRSNAATESESGGAAAVNTTAQLPATASATPATADSSSELSTDHAHGLPSRSSTRSSSKLRASRRASTGTGKASRRVKKSLPVVVGNECSDL